MDDMLWKEDGFKDEKHVIIPTESFAEYIEHPLIRPMYLTPVPITRNGRKGQTSIF